MNITEVRIFKKENADKKLKAFATVTFDDCFVVRDVKVIEGTKGLFVAMPSRRMKQPCPKCNHRNVLRSRYCNNCGSSLEGTSTQPQDSAQRQNEHKDIAHPITLECREYIQKHVLDAYEQQKDASSSGGSHGSISSDFDDLD
ncbi:MAG: septation protein SpoVG family protein [Candidatus Omnitrophica bacterium]|nr:septation protein SpoVG family protein [Candidatus Omnitrophota bacterium]